MTIAEKQAEIGELAAGMIDKADRLIADGMAHGLIARALLTAGIYLIERVDGRAAAIRCLRDYLAELDEPPVPPSAH